MRVLRTPAGRAAAPSFPRTHGRLVPLLRRDRRRHGPRQPHRRRRGARRGARTARTAAVRRVGPRGRAGAPGRHRGQPGRRHRPRPRGGPHLRPHRGAGRGGAVARAGGRPGVGHLRSARRGRGRHPPPSDRPGPLPRGRWSRHDHRRGGDRRRPGGPRHRRGPGQSGGHRDGHGADGPRHAAQPGARSGRAPEGRAHLGPGHPRRAHHTHRRRAAWPPSRRGTARCRPCGLPARGSAPDNANSTSCRTAPRWSPAAGPTRREVLRPDPTDRRRTPGSRWRCSR